MKRLLLALMVICLVALAQSASAADTVYYYYTNTLHSAEAVTDANGNVVERTYYAPYGRVLNRPMRDGPGYTGHEEDPGTGLVYMQQRYFDAESGIFLSVDPVTTDAGTGANFNRYWYANDNPYRYMDPDGRRSGLSGDDKDCEVYHCESITFFDRPSDQRRMERISQQTEPSNVPFDGNESVATIAGRVNAETIGMHDSRNENDSLRSAKIKIATVRINGILKWGKAVQANASLAAPLMSGPGYKSALYAVQTAIAEKMNGIDDTFGVDHSRGGAIQYNMRTPSQAAGDRPFWGLSSHTISGPYISPTKYTYIVTYGK